MNGQDLLLLSKILAVATSAILGVIALAVEQKMIKKQLWTGRLLLLGIVFSGSIAIALEIVQSRVDAAEAESAAEEYKSIIAEINRSLNTIETLNIFGWIHLPNSIAEVAELEAAIKEYILENPELLGDAFFEKGLKDKVSVTVYRSDKPAVIDVDAASPIVPKSFQGFEKISRFPVTVEIRSQAVDESSYRPIMSVGDGNADFIATTIGNDSSSYHYEVDTGTISYQQSVTIDEALWFSNGTVASINDLLGSQLILTVSLPDMFLPLCKKWNEEVSSAEVLMGTFFLKFGRGRRLSLDGTNFTVLSVNYDKYNIGETTRETCSISYQTIIKPEFL